MSNNVLAELVEEGLLTTRTNGQGYTLTPKGVEVAAELLEVSPSARNYLREMRYDRAEGEGRR